MRFDPGAGSFSDARLKSNGARLLNCFIVPRVQVEGNPGSYYVQGSSGLETVADTGQSSCDGLTKWKDGLYGVFGSRLFRVLPTIEDLGEIAGTGVAQFARERTGLAILRDGRQWLYDGDTLTEYSVPTEEDPEVVGTLAELDGYTIYGISDSDKMYASMPLDPTNINALNFATAEARPDNNVRLIVNKLTLWIFGEETVELYYNAGQTGFPFLRYQNAMIEIGLLAPHSALSFHNAVYYIGTDRKVYRGEGLDASPISLPWLEQLFELAGDKLKDATAVAYSLEGIDFYAITVPDFGTYEWNSASKLWSHRRSPNMTTWRAHGHAFFDGGYYVGDKASGRVYRVTQLHPKEGDERIEFELITPPFGPKESRTSLNYVEFGIAVLQGDPATASFQLDYTDDEGRTFRGLREIAFPIIGKVRAIARRLGWMRRRQIRWRYQGDVPFRIEDCYIDMASGWPKRGHYTPEQGGPIPQVQDSRN